eukprot:366520-Chlamydomonas_euryale.AAC.19
MDSKHKEGRTRGDRESYTNSHARTHTNTDFCVPVAWKVTAFEGCHDHPVQPHSRRAVQSKPLVLVTYTTLRGFPPPTRAHTALTPPLRPLLAASLSAKATHA